MNEKHNHYHFPSYLQYIKPSTCFQGCQSLPMHIWWYLALVYKHCQALLSLGICSLRSIFSGYFVDHYSSFLSWFCELTLEPVHGMKGFFFVHDQLNWCEMCSSYPHVIYVTTQVVTRLQETVIFILFLAQQLQDLLSVSLCVNIIFFLSATYGALYARQQSIILQSSGQENTLYCIDLDL